MNRGPGGGSQFSGTFNSFPKYLGVIVRCLAPADNWPLLDGPNYSLWEEYIFFSYAYVFLA